MKFGIDKKIICLFILLIIILGTFLGTYFVRHEIQVLSLELDERAKALVNSLAQSSEYPVLIKNKKMLSDIVQGVLLQKDVVFCEIKDDKGNTLFHSGREEEKYIKEYISPIFTGKPEIKREDELISGTQEKETEEIGKVKLVISLYNLTKEINKVKKVIALIILIAIIVTSVIVILSIRIILSKPVDNLILATHIIANGNFDYRSSIKTRDEIGLLAGSFNKMAGGLKDLQMKLIRQEKLATIGQLAGGVGHELRNPLTNIKNISFAFKMYSKTVDAKDKELLDILSSEVDRANKIVTDLLDFSRVKKLDRVKTFIIPVIEDAISAVKLNKKIEITKEYSPEMKEIQIDKDKIMQVFVNLITNASQSMSDGGKLTISTKLKEDFVEISFTDTGCGMNQETIEHIFEPLFTTKAKGIGLGLAIVRDIVEKHNGKITVKSELGKGTTFTVVLPA